MAKTAPAASPQSGPAIGIEALYTADEIHNRLKGLATEIAAKNPANLMVVPILKGSFVFAADLIRALNAVGLGPEVDFLTLSSYKKGQLLIRQMVGDVAQCMAGRFKHTNLFTRKRQLC